MNVRRSGFTLVEFLTTVALLIIVGGLMVSLARYVKTRSAHLLTVELLSKLEQAMERYHADTRRMPAVHAFEPAQGGVHDTMMRNARLNNADFIRALRTREDLSTRLFGNLPITIYDERTVRDAWGSPIVFMPRMIPEIGMAPDDSFFFFSAGPDGRFLTRDDNLYSYDTVNVGQ